MHTLRGYRHDVEHKMTPEEISAKASSLVAEAEILRQLSGRVEMVRSLIASTQAETVEAMHAVKKMMHDHDNVMEAIRRLALVITAITPSHDEMEKLAEKMKEIANTKEYKADDLLHPEKYEMCMKAEGPADAESTGTPES